VTITGDSKADARLRFADCYDFFSLDGFRAESVDTRMVFRLIYPITKGSKHDCRVSCCCRRH